MRFKQLAQLCAFSFFAFSAIVLTPTAAAADGFISPFIGFNYGGDSGCPTASNCEDKHSNFGVSTGTLGAFIGGEFEFGYAKDFFGSTPGVDTSVLTLMGNVIVGPKIGFVRPYVLGGVGLIKSHVELDAGSLLDSSNNFGWDLGGGLMIMFGDHFGVRGDVRRFKSFNESGIPGTGFTTNASSPLFGLLGDEKLSFSRAVAGVVFSF